MSFIVDAWEADGPKGEAALATLRCNSRAEFAGFVKQWSSDRRCVLITKSRSDKRSMTWEILWIKPGYSSETTPPGTVAAKPTTGRRAKEDIHCCPSCGQRIPCSSE